MDADLWTKLGLGITTSIIGLGGFWITKRQHTLGAQAAHREQYTFAKTFFEDLVKEPPMHAFARQKGFQAIAGSRSIRPAIIQHLMSFVDPVSALQDYVVGKSYLEHSATSAKLEFVGWMVVTHKRRRLWSVAMMAGAFVSYIITVAPYFLWLFALISSKVAISLAAIISPGFVYATAMFAIEARRINTAVRLVKAQDSQADFATQGTAPSIS